MFLIGAIVLDANSQNIFLIYSGEHNGTYRSYLVLYPGNVISTEDLQIIITTKAKPTERINKVTTYDQLLL